MLRRIYYWLPPKLRYIVRRIWFFPSELLSSYGDAPPPGLIFTGAGDYKKQASDWAQFFIDRGLKVDHSFLDIGCGIGRIAYGLKGYLTGKYIGFDPMLKGVKWCQRHIAKEHPNFTFQHILLYNDLYNSGGEDASRHEFSYEDKSFHFVCAISVYTHMLKDEVKNYLEESFRVMRPGSIKVATFFIIEDEDKRGVGDFSFQYKHGTNYIMSKQVKSANVAFEEAELMGLIEEVGFEVSEKIKGWWDGSQRTNDLAFQDVLVLVRP